MFKFLSHLRLKARIFKALCFFPLQIVYFPNSFFFLRKYLVKNTLPPLFHKIVKRKVIASWKSTNSFYEIFHLISLYCVGQKFILFFLFFLHKMVWINLSNLFDQSNIFCPPFSAPGQLLFYWVLKYTFKFFFWFSIFLCERNPFGVPCLQHCQE